MSKPVAQLMALGCGQFVWRLSATAPAASHKLLVPELAAEVFAIVLAFHRLPASYHGRVPISVNLDFIELDRFVLQASRVIG